MPNTYTRLLYHLVFSTKRREPLILPRFRAPLYDQLRQILHNNGGEALEIGGMPDHVHVVARLMPEPSVAKLMQMLKGGSSAWLNQLEDYPAKFYWQEGYGAFTVSPPQLEGVREYVRNQEEHHRVHSFQEEYRKFLDTYGVEYDERYLWD